MCICGCVQYTAHKTVLKCLLLAIMLYLLHCENHLIRMDLDVAYDFDGMNE